jgi:hypothetical protein
MANCLGRRQELALVLNVLPISDPWGVWLFVFNSFYHLVQIKRHRKFLHGFTISIHNKEVSFFVLGPDTALFQVACVNSTAALKRHSKQLEEVIVVFRTELHLFTNLV